MDWEEAVSIQLWAEDVGFRDRKRIDAGREHRRLQQADRQKTYRAIDDFLIPRIVVDVDRDSAQGGDFAGELVELSVVLAFAFVGLGHVRGVGVECFTSGFVLC